jgi:hypothetical protein
LTTHCHGKAHQSELGLVPLSHWQIHNFSDTSKGARKFAQALGDRSRIAQVTMPDDCTINDWNGSNALDAGFTWTDFEQSVQEAIIVPQPPSFKETITDLLDHNPSPFER